MDRNETPDKDAKDKNDLTKYIGFGFEFCGVVVVFCYIGYKIDAAVNSSPFCLLGGFFIGLTGMFYLLYKQINNDKK
jgi:F0F1-type ATP synthase assembly protein I